MICPYLKIKLIKNIVEQLARYIFPPFLKLHFIYIYILIYKYIYDLMNIYIFMYKIHANIDEARIMKEKS